MHKVTILALDDVIPLDLGIACQVFGRAQLADGQPAYSIRVCGERKLVRATSFELRPPGRLAELAASDTVVVPGTEDLDAPVSPRVIDVLRSAWNSGARVVSICTGAFVLGAAGLLDGRRVTTHWAAADELARRFPQAMVAPDVLFVDEGRLVTSAGASAGLDTCLHLVRRDYGQAVAAQAARLAVAPLHRAGGQAQFIRQPPPRARNGVAHVLEWLTANLDRPLDVAEMARLAGMSERTFARRFREQTGSTPLQWLLEARVRRSQEILESTYEPIEQVAAVCGFGSPVTFRARFQSIVGLSPGAYRRSFRPDGAKLRDALG